MMPIVRPLAIPSYPMTEYKNEQEVFAKEAAAFRSRRRKMRRFWQWTGGWCLSVLNRKLERRL